MKTFRYKPGSDQFSAATFFAAFGLLVGMIGCGSAANNGTGPTYFPGAWVGGAACPAGQYGFTGACVADFASACSQAGGYTYAGSKTCRIEIRGAFGLLNPENPLGPNAGKGLNVPAGAVISFSGSGGWSPSSSNSTSFLGIFNVSWGSYSCFSAQVDLNGNKSGTILTNGPLPAGLVGSDGVEVFAVGSNLPSKTIMHSGMLHLGFNIPMGQYATSYSSYICGSYSGVLNITVP